MFTLKHSILAIGLLVSSTLGFNPYNRAQCQYGHICFTSFVWCPTIDDERLGAGKSCTAGPNVYPGGSSQYWGVGAISASGIHQIDWTNVDENFDVLVQLINVDENWTNQQVLWSRSELSYLPVNLKQGLIAVDFTTDRWLNFRLIDLAENAASLQGKNNSREILGTMLAGYSWFNISQPDRASANSSAEWDDISSKFASFQGHIEQYIDAHGEIIWNNTFQRWRLTMGLCLGVAVPVAAALAFLGGMFLEKRRAGWVHKPLTNYMDGKE